LVPHDVLRDLQRVRLEALTAAGRQGRGGQGSRAEVRRSGDGRRWRK
jgi:hypothetical protein